MRTFTFLWMLTGLLTTTQAVYTGDIVQYWSDATSLLINNTIIGGLQSPPSAWAPAIVHSSIYLASLRSTTLSHSLQQVAVSHAAHNSLQWIFHGTRNLGSVDAATKAILLSIGLNASSPDTIIAATIGKKAATNIISRRANDGSNDFVDYVFGPANPGVYQATLGGNPVPDTPESQFLQPFGFHSVQKYADAVPPPPDVKDPKYQDYLLYAKTYGERNSSVRSMYETDTAYVWKESSPAVWNRIAGSVVGSSLAGNVTASARFYAQLNFALANAGIAGWKVKYHFNTWRPITAIRYPLPFLSPPLSTNLTLPQPSWLPLLTPTPSHQDYVSTHATFGGAASTILIAFNAGNEVVQGGFGFSSNVTLDNRGVVSRRYESLKAAAEENGQSRVLGGLHFPFASAAGIALGQAVAKATFAEFDLYWASYL